MYVKYELKSHTSFTFSAVLSLQVHLSAPKVFLPHFTIGTAHGRKIPVKIYWCHFLLIPLGNTLFNGKILSKLHTSKFNNVCFVFSELEGLKALLRLLLDQNLLLVWWKHLHSTSSYWADYLRHWLDSGITLVHRALVSFILAHLTKIFTVQI